MMAQSMLLTAGHTYYTLYLAAYDFSKDQIGIVASLKNLCMLIGSFFAGGIVDRIGRRWGLQIGNWFNMALFFIVSALFPFFPVVCILAVFFGLGTSLSNVAYECIIIENAENHSEIPRTRMTIRLIFLVFSPLLLPLCSYYIARFPLKEAGPVILFTAGGLMAVIFIIRHLLLEETGVGRKKMSERNPIHPVFLLSETLTHLKEILAHPPYAISLGLMISNGFLHGIYSSFIFLYFVESLSLNQAYIGLIHTVSIYGTAGLLLLGIPFFSRLKWRNEGVILGFLILTLIGCLILTGLEAEKTFLIALSAIMIYIGLGLTEIYILSDWLTIAPPEKRSGFISVAGAASSFLNAGVLYLSGLCYQRFPMSIPTILLVILAGTVILAIQNWRYRKNRFKDFADNLANI